MLLFHINFLNYKRIFYYIGNIVMGEIQRYKKYKEAINNTYNSVPWSNHCNNLSNIHLVFFICVFYILGLILCRKKQKPLESGNEQFSWIHRTALCPDYLRTSGERNLCLNLLCFISVMLCFRVVHSAVVDYIRLKTDY